MTKKEERLFGADDSVYKDSIEKGLYSEERMLDDKIETSWKDKLDDKTICFIHSIAADNVVKKDGCFENFLNKIREKISEKDVNTEQLKQYWNSTVDLMLKPGNTKKIEESENDQEYDYMLLDRLKNDCIYYLGNGNRDDKFLWAGNVDGQIAKMRELYHKLKEKPEWLTMKEINDFAKQMKANELPSTVDGTAEQEIQKMLDTNYEKETKVGVEENKCMKTETPKQGIVYTIKLDTKNMEDDKDEIKRVLDILAKAILEHDVSGQTFDKTGEKCLEFTSEEFKLEESNYEYEELLTWVQNLQDIDADEARIIVVEETGNEELADDVATTIDKMKAGE